MMTNYLILYSGGKMPESETEQDVILKEWEAWYGRIGNALVDAGNPFAPRAKSVTSDGRIMESSDECAPSGYSIIQADSLETAVSMVKTCPILKDGAKISVYETFDPLIL
jgi:hypothetical protein